MSTSHSAPTTFDLPPNPARLIEGLRDTGYNFNTALADIVDNSVDAGATKIDVLIRLDMEGEVQISVADNGCGMDRKELRNGMTYGADETPDPSRLGKFGLGLKTASTAFCRRLSVVTRDATDAEPIQAVWDLDFVATNGSWKVIEDEPTADQVETLLRTAADSSGTVVFWDKVDRLLKEYQDPAGKFAQNALKKVVSGFEEHAAMIYQRFLDEDDSRARNIGMTINGNPVCPWDPFCESEPETQKVAERNQEVELPDGSNSAFDIRAFVLPRKTEWSSDTARRTAKATNANQGIYVYRENRLIHPADWLGMYSKEPHFSLLRVEFSFNHDLDRAFHVDIKKSRILLNDDLYNYIRQQFLPAPRNAAESRYRKGTQEKIGELAGSAHKDSNKALQSQEKELRLSEIEVTDASNSEVEISNKQGRFKIKLKIDDAIDSQQLYVKPAQSLDDGLLWEPGLIDGHHAVFINEGHPYYKKVYVPNLSSGVTIQGMDSLLWALAEAENGTISQETKRHFDELRYEVSRLLRKLVEDLPDPKLDEDD